MRVSRRSLLLTMAAGPILASAQEGTSQAPLDWRCPMDPDVHMAGPGKCPKCGMTLVLKVPERVEYLFEVDMKPPNPKPGDEVLLAARASSPVGKLVRQYEVVHERLIHLFVVSENLEFFEHVHPELRPDGTFQIRTRLPNPGMYRLLADYYPSGSVPQLSLATLYVDGPTKTPDLLRNRAKLPQYRARPAKSSGFLADSGRASAPFALKPVLTPQRSVNLEAKLRTEPEEPVAGLLSRLFYDLDPWDGLEPYLGTWAHMLIASSDLIDMIHLHPFLVNRPTIQFNVIFPRPGLHRIWTQFQRNGMVNTAVFTVPVREI